MTQMGTYSELLSSSSSFKRLLDNIHQQEQEQHERPIDFQRTRSLRCSTHSEKENNEEELLPISETLEMKRTGSINCHVYISYLRAGAGLVLGICFITFVFGIREAASIFYSWWLAKWSEDESHRYRYFNNCTNVTNQQINVIRLMSDIEWNDYRNERFYFYCGL
jgi:hypothetical protein